MHWLNSIRLTSVPESGFLTGNLPFLVITTLLAVCAASIRHKVPALALLIWLSYIMFANTIFHVTATTMLHRYCPGLITAVLLYLPYFFWIVEYFKSRFRIQARTVAAAAVLATLVVYLQWHTVLSEAAHRMSGRVH
jgi:hypothetical protein